MLSVEYCRLKVGVYIESRVSTNAHARALIPIDVDCACGRRFEVLRSLELLDGGLVERGGLVNGRVQNLFISRTQVVRLDGRRWGWNRRGDVQEGLPFKRTLNG
jgi:hypothetical protein